MFPLRNQRLVRILFAKLCADASISLLLYGALITSTGENASSFRGALVVAVSISSPVLWGLAGGFVADLLPRRHALTGAYLLQGICSLAVLSGGEPSQTWLIVLVFLVMLIGQVSGPTELAVLPMVVPSRRVPLASSLTTMAGAAGSGIGAAILMPLLMSPGHVVGGLTAAAILFGLSSVAVFEWHHFVPGYKDAPHPQREVPRQFMWFPRDGATRLLVAVLATASAAQAIITALGPDYVVAGGVDPEYMVYIFGGSGIGIAVALLTAPLIIERFGERASAITGLLMIGCSLLGLGFARRLAPLLGGVTPLELIPLPGFDEPEMRVATLVTVILGFGASLASKAVEVHINRVVDPPLQARAFAVLSTLKATVTLAPLLLAGVGAEAAGVRTILSVSAIAPLLVAVFGYRVTTRALRGQSWRPRERRAAG